jgi:ubiquinone/menaquinone biosynthesis C-methylase UbiE
MTSNKEILDVCCGGRMFWFDKRHPLAVFVDKRRETLVAGDRGHARMVRVNPDVIADFRALPFPNSRFSLVVFDPPHLTRNGRNSWMAKKYGTLDAKNWRDDIRRGFCECFRVLKKSGVLVFKWNETDILIGDVLKLAPTPPLIGHRSGKAAKTHWLVFMKT